MNKLIVGDKNCSFGDIAITMGKEPSTAILLSYWSTLAHGLSTPQSVVKELRLDLLLKKLGILDVIVNLLEDWRSRLSESAKLTALLDILEHTCGWEHMAGNLHAKFKMTVDSDTFWNDLDRRTQAEIMKREVKFLGVRKSLKDALCVLDEIQQTQILNETVRGQTILKLLQPGDFILACDTLPMKADIYIPRTISSRRNVDLKILQADCPDIFIVQNVGTLKLAELAGNEPVDKSSRQARNLTVRFITLDFQEDFELICRHVKYNSVHLLDFKQTHLIWQRTFGNLHQIQEHLAPDINPIPELEFSNFISKNEDNSPICIADAPGMGKSLLLANLCKQRRDKISDKIIIFLKFTNLFPYITLEENGKQEETKDILQTIMDKVSANELGRSLLTHILKTHSYSIELFIDGFDEIPPSRLRIATDQLRSLATGAKRIQIVATTRMHKQEQMERALGTLSFNILPFTEIDQQKFLEDFWHKRFAFPSNDNLCKFARILVYETRSNIRSGDSEIAGIPQQCAMLAEIYENEAKKYANPKNPVREICVHVKSIHEIYEKLLKLRFGHVSEDSVRDLLKAVHQMAALELLFPDSLQLFPQLAEIQLFIPNLLEELSRVGLLIAKKDGSLGSEAKIKLDFLHRTYAEFIAAEFIAQNVNSISERISVQMFFFSNFLVIIESDGGVRFDSNDCGNAGVWNIMRGHPTAEECRGKWVELSRFLNLGPEDIMQINGFIQTEEKSHKPRERERDCLWRLLFRWSDGGRRQPQLSELVEALCSNNFHGMADQLKTRYYRKLFHSPTTCFFLDNFLAKLPVTPEITLLTSQLLPSYSFLLESCIFHDFINLFRLVSKCCLLSKNLPSFKSQFPNVSWSHLILRAIRLSSRNLLEECCTFVEEMEGKQLSELEFHRRCFGSWEFTPLHAACERGDASIFHFLFMKFGKRMSHMNGLLHFCTRYSFRNSDEVIRGKIEIMEALLKFNPAFLEEKDPQSNRTPTNVVGVHLRLLEFLMEKGANTRTLDTKGYSVVYDAAIQFSPEDFHGLAELLLRKDCGDVFFLEDENGDTQLCSALELVGMKVETLELLAPHLKSHFQTHGNSYELFGAVAGLQRKPVLEVLVQLGADPKPNWTSKSNYLHLAAQFGNVEAIQYFYSLGLNVNARDIYDRTPLHVAMTMGQRNLDEVVMALLESGADAAAVDAQRKTAVWYADNPDSIRNLNNATLQALRDAALNAKEEI